jgi:hypothetical protein
VSGCAHAYKQPHQALTMRSSAQTGSTTPTCMTHKIICI